MNEDTRASMADKAAQLADLMRRTDKDGRIAAPVETEADKRRDALERGLRVAVDNGDEHAAGVIAEALANNGDTDDGRAVGGARTGSPGPADQGARPPIPGPGPLAERIAQAETAGDWQTAIALKAQQSDELRRRADHDNARGIYR